mmetsp:Transcript_27193/g.54439  ORF Transcript_27193/g.54439 Transcript_27193/m.54439 type:complete len:560 (+) Transcript_27193:176-1855(+)
MASSIQPQQSQRHRLTERANSHGPYLWSGDDIENALLWFPCATKQHAAKPSQQHHQVENNETTAAEEEAITADLLEKDRPSSNTSISSSAEQVDNNEGCEFLRLLLHSRGIWNPRPPKKKKRSIATSKSAYSSSDDDNNSKKKRKKKRKRKRKDNSNRVDGSKRSSSNNTELSSSPLQSVLMGYYQLFHQKEVVVTPSDSSVKDRNNNSDDDDKDNGTATAAAATIQASSKLYNDLTTIISSRRHTHELYQASLHAATLSSSSSQPLQGDQNHKFNISSKKIDQYMVHPTTCARRVYASCIYDRLLHLASTADNNEEEVLTTTSKEVQNFLQKLLGLATAADDKDGKIQEVILLLMLEPLRRLQTRQLMMMKKKKSEEKMEGQDCWNLPPQNQHREELMELFPLLTSQIVSPSAASATNNLKDESPSPLVTLLVQSILHTNLDTWWHQPSPLLCTISQYNFPIACKYLHYWVDRALVTHESCYQNTSNDEEMEAFHHAVERIQEFHRTSHRLRSLLSHVICNMGEEIRMSASGLIDEDEDESEVFKTSLALRAIQRALE